VYYGSDGALAMARILVIDDEEVIRLAVGAALRRYGHDVSAAVDGEEGVNLFQRQTFDLVITDVNMPRLNGPEVIKAVRSLRPAIPIIIIGGGGSIPPVGSEQFAQQVGADRVLLKPFAMQQLIAVVSELLNLGKGG
jgi:CheY-like chemotaxis protein